MSDKQDWFASWFDTPYYHILYKHRDQTEAQAFIDRLFEVLKPSLEDDILDLACGRGRHAVYMNQKGHRVRGYDLAPESIEFANQFANERLQFAVKDMRDDLGNEVFDWVFNLFTSFGYFDQLDDDLRAMQAIYRCLKPGGKLVLDFMNAHKVAKRLVPNEVKQAEGITFNIERFIRDGHIIKDIRFEAEGKKFYFEEKVKTYCQADFEKLFQLCGLRLVQSFGSLNLDSFDPEHSDRLILVAEKE